MIAPPANDFPLVELGSALPHKLRGALQIQADGTTLLYEPGAEKNLGRVKASALGEGSCDLESQKFTQQLQVNVVDSSLPTGLCFTTGNQGYVPATNSLYQIEFGVYTGTSGTQDPIKAPTVRTSSGARHRRWWMSLRAVSSHSKAPRERRS